MCSSVSHITLFIRSSWKSNKPTWKEHWSQPSQHRGEGSPLSLKKSLTINPNSLAGWRKSKTLKQSRSINVLMSRCPLYSVTKATNEFRQREWEQWKSFPGTLQPSRAERVDICPGLSLCSEPLHPRLFRGRRHQTAPGRHSSLEKQRWLMTSRSFSYNFVFHSWRIERTKK